MVELFSAIKLSKAKAWLLVLGKPSKIKPLESRFFRTTSFNISIVTWSGTKSPLSIYDFAIIPRGVLFFILNLKTSPVDM